MGHSASILCIIRSAKITASAMMLHNYYDPIEGLTSMHIKDETKHQVGFLCVEKRTFQGAKKVLVGTCFWIHLHNFQRNVVFGYLVYGKACVGNIP